MPVPENQPLISELCSVETSNTDLAQAKDDPFQIPDYDPGVPHTVGENDSLTDQPRQSVSEGEQMAPAASTLR